MSDDVKVIGTNEKGEPTKLHITEYATLNDRGQLMLEASAIATDIRTLNMRLAGLGMTPKPFRDERRQRMMRERVEKMQRLKELKTQYDALSPTNSPNGQSA